VRTKLRTHSALFVCSLIVGHSFFLTTITIVQPVIIHHGQNILFLTFEILFVFSLLSHSEGNRHFLIGFSSDDLWSEFRVIPVNRFTACLLDGKEELYNTIATFGSIFIIPLIF
jgi:hypothetical protein